MFALVEITYDYHSWENTVAVSESFDKLEQFYQDEHFDPWMEKHCPFVGIEGGVEDEEYCEGNSEPNRWVIRPIKYLKQKGNKLNKKGNQMNDKEILETLDDARTRIDEVVNSILNPRNTMWENSDRLDELIDISIFLKDKKIEIEEYLYPNPNL